MEMTISNRALEYFAVNSMVWMTQLYIIVSNGEEGTGKKKKRFTRRNATC